MNMKHHNMGGHMPTSTLASASAHQYHTVMKHTSAGMDMNGTKPMTMDMMVVSKEFSYC